MVGVTFRCIISGRGWMGCDDWMSLQVIISLHEGIIRKLAQKPRPPRLPVVPQQVQGVAMS